MVGWMLLLLLGCHCSITTTLSVNTVQTIGLAHRLKHPIDHGKGAWENPEQDERVHARAHERQVCAHGPRREGNKQELVHLNIPGLLVEKKKKPRQLEPKTLGASYKLSKRTPSCSLFFVLEHVKQRYVRSNSETRDHRLLTPQKSK